jgi:hypothetical protein
MELILIKERKYNMYKKKFTQISNLFGLGSKVSSCSQSELMKQTGKFHVLVDSASKATRGAGGSWLEARTVPRRADD